MVFPMYSIIFPRFSHGFPTVFRCNGLGPDAGPRGRCALLLHPGRRKWRLAQAAQRALPAEAGDHRLGFLTKDWWLKMMGIGWIYDRYMMVITPWSTVT